MNFVQETGERWRRLHSDPTHLKELLWQHDNARPHTAIATKKFFEKRQVQMIQQSPYSPDLNLCDRWLFKVMKKGLRGHHFQSSQEVLEASLEVFRGISPQRFQDELHNLRDHCYSVIAALGNYITK